MTSTMRRKKPAKHLTCLVISGAQRLRLPLFALCAGAVLVLVGFGLAAVKASSGAVTHPSSAGSANQESSSHCRSTNNVRGADRQFNLHPEQ
ncbi:hypothetical protein [Lentzea sp. NPDC004782]|uniref:hypothetical protein n=1 Tax=Lentzea sp. NPDC004782 TaxID=3154458 RepID=UPI0033B30166